MAKLTKLDDVDAVNALWWKRHSVRYPFAAEVALNTVKPDDNIRAAFGHFIYAPFPKQRVTRWGFLTEKARDDFCKRFKGRRV